MERQQDSQIQTYLDETFCTYIFNLVCYWFEFCSVCVLILFIYVYHKTKNNNKHSNYHSNISMEWDL